MTKKSLTILILFLLVILGIAFFGYQLFKSDTAPLPGEEGTTKPRRNFFFFGNRDPEPTDTSVPGVEEPGFTETPTGSTTVPTVNIPRLRQLTTAAVSGGMASSTGSTTLVRYIERGTGHALENDMISLADSTTLSNTTIPKIYEAIWNTKGDKVLLRYTNDLGSISTFSADLLPVRTSNGTGTPSVSRSPYELKGVYLTSNIKNIALSPKADKMFYTVTGSNGAAGYTSSLNESGRVLLWDSPLKNWLAEWPEEDTITMTTSPTGYGLGYLYFVNSKNGSEKKVLGSVRGLTTLTSKDAQKVLYSRSLTDSFQTFIYNTAEDTTDDVPFITLPEKCIWGNLNKNDLYCAVPIQVTPGIYPDVWYQGKVSFIDKIWYINTSTGEARLLSDLYNESGKSIDAINLKLDATEDFLIFMNKNDLTLWSLDISE